MKPLEPGCRALITRGLSEVEGTEVRVVAPRFDLRAHNDEIQLHLWEIDKKLPALRSGPTRLPQVISSNLYPEEWMMRIDGFDEDEMNEEDFEAIGKEPAYILNNNPE